MVFDLHVFRMALFLATFGFLSQLTTAAHAMNFYNNSSIALYASFTCGVFCSNTWTVEAGDMKSRPNEAGALLVESAFGAYGCDDDVDEHGWVVATGTDETNIVLTSYHQDGSVDETCNFD